MCESVWDTSTPVVVHSNIHLSCHWSDETVIIATDLRHPTLNPNRLRSAPPLLSMYTCLPRLYNICSRIYVTHVNSGSGRRGLGKIGGVTRDLGNLQLFNDRGTQ